MFLISQLIISSFKLLLKTYLLTQAFNLSECWVLCSLCLFVCVVLCLCLCIFMKMFFVCCCFLWLFGFLFLYSTLGNNGCIILCYRNKWKWNEIAYPCERFTLISSFNMLKGAHIHVLWNLNNRGTQNEWFISECESCFFPYNESEWWPWLSSKSFQSHQDFCDIWGMFVLFWNENPPIIMMYFYNYL